VIVRPTIEEYARVHTTPPSLLLAEVARATAAETDHPEMMIGAIEGGLLAMIVAMLRPQRILEIGTFTGYSALSMAEAMPDDCRLVTLEADARHAAIARRHFDASPYADRIVVVEGSACDTMATLSASFDLVFIDADKASYVRFLDAALPLLSDRGVVVVDNALHFAISSEAQDAAGIQAFNRYVASRSDLTQVLLTVRAGMLLIRRAAPGDRRAQLRHHEAAAGAGPAAPVAQAADLPRQERQDLAEHARWAWTDQSSG
jgi:caffeoyl-CoA O-methyltransferase